MGIGDVKITKWEKGGVATNTTLSAYVYLFMYAMITFCISHCIAISSVSTTDIFGCKWD